jgi:hypothetical protein
LRTFGLSRTSFAVGIIPNLESRLTEEEKKWVLVSTGAICYVACNLDGIYEGCTLPPSLDSRSPLASPQYRMDESKKIILLNIEYYQRLLATETDPKEREAIARLLAEQQAKLREIERKGRGT